jgi:putative transposase
MVKNRKLAKSISAAWYGKEVVKVDRWFASSKTCSCCGWKNEILTLADKTFNCPVCGLSKERDLNAAENILQQALSVSSAILTPSECQTLLS